MAKKPKPQPTKYDRYALEAEFLAGEDTNIAKFFRTRKIPLRTGERMSVGWREKWKAIRVKGLNTFKNRLAKEIAEQAESELIASKGVMKIGVDGLFPSDGAKALKPTTAMEAARMIEIGNKIRRNVTDNMKEAVRIEMETTTAPGPSIGPSNETNTPTASPSTPLVIKIKLPSNVRFKDE